MPILKTITLPSGVQASFHRVQRVTYTPSAIRIDVASWPGQAQHDEGAAPLALAPVFDVALQTTVDVFGTAEAALVVADGAYQGGAIADAVATDPLDAAKARRWSELKLQRDQAEAGGFEWDGSPFDSDQASQLKIIGAAAAAVVAEVRWLTACMEAIAAQAGIELPPIPDFAQAWTLADNAVRTLHRTDIVDVGLALLEHDATVHAIGRTLREAVEAAETPAEVLAVAWPP